MPRAFAVLEQFAPGAADEAVAAALPEMDAPTRAVAFAMIVRRGHGPTLTDVVGSFHASAPELQQLVIGSWRDLEGAFRTVAASRSFERRASAIEAIVAADAVELSYLLTDAIKGGCEATRELAAHALSALAESVVDRSDRAGDGPLSAQDATRMARIVEALGDGIYSWDLHRNRELLETALRCGRRIVPAVRRKMSRRPTQVDRPIGNILGTARDPRLAEFLWCAFAMPELRESAVEAIASAREPELIRAILDNAWLLADPAVAAGFKEVRSCPWLFGECAWGGDSADDDAVRVVGLIEASGAKHDAKIGRLEVLWRDGSETVRRVATWALLRDRTNAATELLLRIAALADADLAALIRRELDARERTSGGADRAMRRGENLGGGVDRTPMDALDTLFADFDGCSAADRRFGALAFEADTGRLAAGLRKRLRGSNDRDRRHALTLIRELGWSADFSEYVCRLSHDHDPRTRSLAVAMLADLPGPTSHRILRTAVDDTDERVQANAVEAIDRLNAPDRVTLLQPKLDASGNRVRANAVRSLMRLGVREAFQGLSAMLSEPSVPHRLSALWVVERAGLASLVDRLERMAVLDPDPRVRARAARTLGRLGRGDRLSASASALASEYGACEANPPHRAEDGS